MDKTLSFGFEQTEVRPLPEIEATLHKMVHLRSGAQLIWLERKDENKTFSVTFRTLPWDDSGVFHILEHSVLCGSEKYPVKEPFVELLKSSLNTFLNAMTYPDKTCYPVCSKNDKDFLNLIDVYMDGVFHPLIYQKPEILGQEGWHYAFHDDGSVHYKGVVYNEMRGVFADPESLMENEMNRLLFPENCYRFVSGGDPKSIPTLTQDRFLEAHRRFYHPANAYFVLDGDLNLEEVLPLLDGYLSLYDRAQAQEIAPIVRQKPVFSEEREVLYEIGPEEPAENRSMLGFGYVLGDYSCREEIVAMSVLGDVLCGSNHAPLRKALLDAGLAEDVYLAVVDGVFQPWALLEVKNLRKDNSESVKKVISATLENLVKDGLDREQLSASLASYEFKMRERDFGSMPKGLVFALTVLEGWLYGGDPVQNLLVGDLFDTLREKMQKGYFEKLIDRFLLHNSHACCVKMIPSAGIGGERRAEESAKLQRISSSWSEAERTVYLSAEKTLEAWQNSEDSPEALASLPVLTLEDLKSDPEKIPCKVDSYRSVPVLRHEISTGGIIYVNLYFDLYGYGDEDFSRLAFLKCLLSDLPTLKHTGPQTQALIRLLCGNLDFEIVSYTKPNNRDSAHAKFLVSFSTLPKNLQKAVELTAEILEQTVLDDDRAVLDLLRQYRIGFYQSVTASGLNAAVSRVAASVGVDGAIGECVGGLTFYRWLQNLERDFSSHYPVVLNQMKQDIVNIFALDRLTVSVTQNESGAEETVIDSLYPLLPRDGGEKRPNFVAVKPKTREGIVVSSDVCHAVKGGWLVENGGEFSERARLAARIASLSYLWNVIRVQGGAYGAGLLIRESGFAGCYSFRDPNAKNSLAAYDSLLEFLTDFCNSCTDLTSFIIGAVADASPLLTPRMQASVSDSDYFRAVSFEQRSILRQQMLQTRPKDLLALAPAIGETVKQGGFCVVGSKEQIDALGTLDEIHIL